MHYYHDDVHEQLHFWYDAQNRPAIVDYNGVKYAYVYNLQGDVVGLVDDTGILVVEYVYDAWGKPTGKTGTMASTLGTVQPFRYRGYMFDEETGLYNLKSRCYSPKWSRFISIDVIGLSSCSLYACCENCPISYDDESGNMPKWVLNHINFLYANGTLYSSQVSTYVLLLNGAGFGTACHEIAQLNVARQLESLGYTVSLEYETSNGEADIVAARCIWEIKPYATSGQSQLKKYIEATGFSVGFPIAPIYGIQVVGNIHMDIIPSDSEPGVINYTLYLDDSTRVNSREVARQVGFNLLLATVIFGGIMGATVIEDYLSGGAGIADDIPSLVLALHLAGAVLGN